MTQQGTNEEPRHEEVPEGFYKARAVGESEPHVLYGESSGNNEQVAIEMNLLDLNRTVMVILNFSDAAAPFSIERLKALGWQGGDDMKGITANEVQVRAKREAWVDRTTQQQKTGMKYEIMTGQRFAFQKPLDETQKRGFFSRLKTLASQEAPPKGAAQGGGYPPNWDSNGPATPPPQGRKPVDLG